MNKKRGAKCSSFLWPDVENAGHRGLCRMFYRLFGTAEGELHQHSGSLDACPRREKGVPVRAPFFRVYSHLVLALIIQLQGSVEIVEDELLCGAVVERLDIIAVLPPPSHCCQTEVRALCRRLSESLALCVHIRA